MVMMTQGARQSGPSVDPGPIASAGPVLAGTAPHVRSPGHPAGDSARYATRAPAMKLRPSQVPASGEAVVKAVVETTSEPYQLPNQPGWHTAEIRFINGEIVPGVNSTWTTVEKIREALEEAGVPQNDVDDLMWDVEMAYMEVVQVQQALQKAEERNFALPVNPAVSRKRARQEAWDAEAEEREAVKQLAVAASALRAECKAVHQAAWQMYQAELSVHLMPAGELFNEKQSTADLNHPEDYSTGADRFNAIPIVWYKAPEDYPRLRLDDGEVVKPFAEFALPGRTFGVADDNQPELDMVLRKVAHKGDRSEQGELNKDLIENNVQVEKSHNQFVFFAGAGYDGDHVKDLGFGGKDAINNYWPLEATINQRAFNGYNSLYIVNYLDADDVLRARAIGGLIGKWFKIKGFLDAADGPVPVETNTAEAGRDH
jgi:hypothetical protein